MKYVAPIYKVGIYETADDLKELQSQDCKKEMEKVRKEFISCYSFISSAERALAIEIFESAWRLARYYEELCE